MFGGVVANPALNPLHPYGSGLVLAECAIIEAFLYGRMFELDPKEALLVSLCANLAGAALFFA